MKEEMRTKEVRDREYKYNADQWHQYFGETIDYYEAEISRLKSQLKEERLKRIEMMSKWAAACDDYEEMKAELRSFSYMRN